MQLQFILFYYSEYGMKYEHWNIQHGPNGEGIQYTQYTLHIHFSLLLLMLLFSEAISNWFRLQKSINWYKIQKNIYIRKGIEDSKYLRSESVFDSQNLDRYLGSECTYSRITYGFQWISNVQMHIWFCSISIIIRFLFHIKLTISSVNELNRIIIERQSVSFFFNILMFVQF